MALPKPTIVLFDMDGTTVRHINPRLLHALEKLDDAYHRGAKFFSRVLKRPIEAKPLVEIRHGKRPKLLVHRAMHRMRRQEVDRIVEPCPGIYAILDLLQSKGIRMGLISNGLGKGYGHDILRIFDLERYYQVTLFREDLRRPKPYPDPLLQAAEALTPAVTTDDVIWYAGDRHKDIVAALAANDILPCPVVPIAYTLHAAIAVLERNVGADHIIMGWPDLEPKLRQLLN